ncbi:hypothetical protein [Rosistilla oblonga]|uniref:hypothetical protein n=1 Tax=Rosistilla oblonga TaxID=2527990 RepID=UPI003A97F3AD
MGQDKNAGNTGDQLKHSLTAEVLMSCLDWPTITYAETHAGAGCFDAQAQSNEGKTHITDLKGRVASQEANERQDAGGRYHELLASWWSETGNASMYPGSVVQSAIILDERKERPRPDFRVTEACPDTCERLKNSLSEFGVSPVNDGFQNRIEWLTENDNLVLIIDPYALTERGKFDKGQVDLMQLSNVLDRCWQKSACVVGFWYSTPQGTSSETKAARQNAIKSWAESNDAVTRSFGYWIYDMIWLGIGEGKAAVNAIPHKTAWKQSWLSRIVKEKGI